MSEIDQLPRDIRDWLPPFPLKDGGRLMVGKLMLKAQKALSPEKYRELVARIRATHPDCQAAIDEARNLPPGIRDQFSKDEYWFQLPVEDHLLYIGRLLTRTDLTYKQRRILVNALNERGFDCRVQDAAIKIARLLP
jgi:hypothetical protein